MMGRISIDRERTTDTAVTAVSNLFIDQYMSEANAAQLKIYLWLLRTMRAGRSTSPADLAERFNLTESDVTRALHFWEKRGIISMEYDRDKKLSSIRLEDISRVDEPERLPLPTGAERSGGSYRQEAARGRAPSPEPRALSRAAERREDAPQEEDAGQIRFIAEQYLGRPLGVNELQSLYFIRDDLGFSEDLVDYLLQYCLGREKRDFRYIERVAVRWKEAGYETPEQAKRGSYKYDRRVYETMGMLGLSNAPTDLEAGLVEKWISDYHMPMEVIREACGRTVLATQNRRLEYANAVLQRWHEAGVTRKGDIQRLDEAHEAVRGADRQGSREVPAQAKGHNARVHNFPERTYDFSKLEKKLAVIR